MASLMTLDLSPLIDAFAEFGRVVAESVATYARTIEPMLVEVWKGWQWVARRWEWEARERDRREFEWRLAHRALTPGQ